MSEKAFNWEGDLQYAALTDVGMRRSNNQDSHAVQLAPDLASWRSRGHLFMVADGMGAHAAGELASKMAVDNVALRYQKFAEALDSPPEALQKSIIETNLAIHTRGQANSDFRHMGTTGSVLVLLPQGALIAQIGDSRIYRLRGDQLEQLTRDHSLVWELRELGQISDSNDAVQVPKNVITRSLGPNINVEADIEGPMSVATGDVFLLCSDGLTGKIEDHELAAVLAHLSPDEAAQFFVNLANLRGGPDNITAIVVRVVGARLATHSDSAEPIKIGRGSLRRDSNDLLVWVAAAVFGLAVFVLFLTHNPIPAAIAAIASATLALIGLLRPSLRARRGVVLSGGRRLGRGPYTRTACPSDEEAVSMLAKVCADLQRTVEQRDLAIDLGDFHARCDAARRAAESNRRSAAVAEYARATRVLMHAIREDQRKRMDDSAIEL